VQQMAAEERVDLAPFVQALQRDPPHRVRGTAIFLTSDPDAVPHALLHNLKHNQVLHQRIVILRVEGTDVPRVDPGHRLTAEDLGGGFWKVTVRHGFMETPDVPEFMKLLTYQRGISTESMTTSYFVSRDTVATGALRAMSRPRQAVFAWLHRNSSRASDYFRLPANRVVEFGRRP